jgi:hypothetical protein
MGPETSPCIGSQVSGLCQFIATRGFSNNFSILLSSLSDVKQTPSSPTTPLSLNKDYGHLHNVSHHVLGLRFEFRTSFLQSRCSTT